MDPAPSDRVTTLPRRAAVHPPDLTPAGLARLFGIADLPDRLAAVDERITAVLGHDGALLGPASVRVATSGGKRLRPLFTIVAAATGGVFDQRVVDVAAAVELVQVGSLVHDDILDEAATRRGRPTINAVEGVNHAVLAGDYILARAAELAAGVSREAAQLVAVSLGDLCEGQVLEMRDAFDPDRSVDSHLASVRAKTAALFECACRLGAQVAGLAEENTQALARFGHGFGMAFQVLDDVLDLIGDEERLGKPTGNDIASGVYTLPVLAALQGPAGPELRRALAGAGAAPGTRAGVPALPPGNGHAPGGSARPDPDDAGRSTAEVTRAIELVRRSGTIAEALTAADRYADEARRAVAHLNQTTVGEGLGLFPRIYSTWALENLMDPRYLETPLTALG